MIVSGFAIFTAIDGLVTAGYLSGFIGTQSLWWIELALAPFAIVSIPILRWCLRQWGNAQKSNHCQQFQVLYFDRYFWCEFDTTGAFVFRVK